MCGPDKLMASDMLPIMASHCLHELLQGQQFRSVPMQLSNWPNTRRLAAASKDGIHKQTAKIEEEE